MNTVILVAGTRPEAIKVAPVATAMTASAHLRPHLVTTGQHADLAPVALAELGVAADEEHTVGEADRASQHRLLAAVVDALTRVVAEQRAAAILVQGDTVSAFAGALAGLWTKTPVVHLEAGLRSGDLHQPFPEEAYRRQIAVLAALHLAPTRAAVANLLAEGVDPATVVCIGNTVIDAAQAIGRGALPPHLAVPPGARRLLVTTHRRENWGEPLAGILDAVRRLADDVTDLDVVIPVHPNPIVHDVVHRLLGDHPRITLLDPVPYGELVGLLATSTLVLTDSGGIQEEAPTFGVPTLVLREVTERTEAVDAGCSLLVGTDGERIHAAAHRLLTDEGARQAMARVANPFGDGKAAARTVDAITHLLGHGPAPVPWEPPEARAADR